MSSYIKEPQRNRCVDHQFLIFLAFRLRKRRRRPNLSDGDVHRCRGSILSLLPQDSLSLLLLVESLSLDLSLILKLLEKVHVLPSNTISQFSDNSEISDSLETHNSQSSGDDNTLLLVVRVGDSLKCGETTERLLSTLGFLVYHTANTTPYHTSGGLEMVRSLSGVGVHTLLTELCVFDTVTNHCSEEKIV